MSEGAKNAARVHGIINPNTVDKILDKHQVKASGLPTEVCVWVYACSYVCLRVCMYACTYVCVYENVCMFVFEEINHDVNVCVHICMYACTHACVYENVCIQVCMYCVHVHA